MFKHLRPRLLNTYLTKAMRYDPHAYWNVERSKLTLWYKGAYFTFDNEIDFIQWENDVEDYENNL